MRENIYSIEAEALITLRGFFRSRHFILLILFFVRSEMSYSTTFPVNERTRIYTEEINGDSIALKVDNSFPILVSAKVNVDLSNLDTSSGYEFSAVVPANTSGYTLAGFKKRDSSKSYKCSYQWKIVLGDISKTPDLTYFYEYPFRKGLNYKISQGPGGHVSHKDTYAFDFVMPVGTPITAARDGVVALLKSDSETGGPDRKFIEEANFISIYHSDGTMGTYLHLKKDGILVKDGQAVKRGEIIGYSGNTGFSSGPHLHFEVTHPHSDFGNKWISFEWEPRNNKLLSALFKGDH